MPKTIIDLQKEAWQTAEDKGFHTSAGICSREDILARLCLIHTEVSEAAQEVKRYWIGEPKPEQIETFAEELADVVIRVFDLCGTVGADLQSAIEKKMAKNADRPYAYGTASETK